MIQLFLWLLVFFPLSAAAQTDFSQIAGSKPSVLTWEGLSIRGDKSEFVRPKRSAPIREMPPTGGLWGAFPGKRVGETDTNTCYKIVEKKKIPYGFSNQTWVRLAPMDDKGNWIESLKWWSYWGETSADESTNFHIFHKSRQTSECLF